MKLIKTEDAVGHVLCHDITQIIKGVTKDAVFRKGHIITEKDIPVLLSVGKDNIYVWEKDDNMLHEDEAAEILRSICQNENMHATAPKEGKIELIADIDGLLLVDLERLRAINSLGDIMIAARHSGFMVKKGDKLCGTRVIPLVIAKERMEQAKLLAGDEPIMRLVPVRPRKYGLVTTGNEVFYGRIEDTFSPVVQAKLAEFGCEMAEMIRVTVLFSISSCMSFPSFRSQWDGCYHRSVTGAVLPLPAALAGSVGIAMILLPIFKKASG